MEKIITKDNSITFKNKELDECYHSISGAREESIKKYAEPCTEHIKGKTKIAVLDICFGLGYNTAAFLELNPNLVINITAIEKDSEILSKIKELENSFSSYSIIKRLIEENKLSISENNKSITLYIEDARKTVKELKEKFDVCFLDPFSPKKCPELWTEEFLKDIYNLMNPGGILATYSCARVVRDNLKKAGFIVKDGPCIGRRAPSTIAVKLS